MNIINKFIKSEKKEYSVEMTMDHEDLVSNLEMIGKIIELPENDIRTFRGFTVSKKGVVKVTFGAERDCRTFRKGANKYINYRCMATTA